MTAIKHFRSLASVRFGLFMLMRDVLGRLRDRHGPGGSRSSHRDVGR